MINTTMINLGTTENSINVFVVAEYHEKVLFKATILSPYKSTIKSARAKIKGASTVRLAPDLSVVIQDFIVSKVTAVHTKEIGRENNIFTLTNPQLNASLLGGDVIVENESFSEWVDAIFPLISIPLSPSQKEDFKLHLTRTAMGADHCLIKTSPDALSEVLHRLTSKKQFIEKFGRAPKLDALLLAINPENFPVKEFSQAMATLPEVKIAEGQIDPLPFVVVLSEVIGVELAFKFIERIRKEFPSFSSFAFPARVLSIQDKQDKETFTNRARVLFTALLEGKFETISLQNITSSLPLFLEKSAHLLKNKDWVAIDKFFTQVRYAFNPESPLEEELANACGKAGVSEESFLDRYLPLFKKAQGPANRQAKHFPTISGKLAEEGLGWEFLDATDARAYTVGLETNCCQHLDSIGGDCVIFMAENPSTSGILRIFRLKGGATIAQSFMWLELAEKEFQVNKMVFDNIEVLGGELRDSIINAYKDAADAVMSRKYLKFGRESFIFGGGCSDIDTSAFKKLNSWQSALVPARLGYSDATNSQYSLF